MFKSAASEAGLHATGRWHRQWLGAPVIVALILAVILIKPRQFNPHAE
jgi:hypothetical protein